jgi:hypothetical protein
LQKALVTIIYCIDQEVKISYSTFVVKNPKKLKENYRIGKMLGAGNNINRYFNFFR